jgi:hypothetical protein
MSLFNIVPKYIDAFVPSWYILQQWGSGNCCSWMAENARARFPSTTTDFVLNWCQDRTNELAYLASVLKNNDAWMEQVWRMDGTSVTHGWNRCDTWMEKVWRMDGTSVTHGWNRCDTWMEQVWRMNGTSVTHEWNKCDALMEQVWHMNGTSVTHGWNKCDAWMEQVWRTNGTIELHLTLWWLLV